MFTSILFKKLVGTKMAKSIETFKTLMLNMKARIELLKNK